MSSVQGQRIQANCKIIWGDDSEYDLDAESDDYINYTCFVRKDYGTSFGPPLTMTGLCYTREGAWAELDRRLKLWARQVQRGTPMTRDEHLEIFGGPRGKYRHILSICMDAFEKSKGTKHA
jgi:hypothetical protein